jgi:pimeloyl-ACP methyl ester carboxylesterase
MNRYSPAASRKIADAYLTLNPMPVAPSAKSDFIVSILFSNLTAGRIGFDRITVKFFCIGLPSLSRSTGYMESRWKPIFSTLRGFAPPIFWFLFSWSVSHRAAADAGGDFPIREQVFSIGKGTMRVLTVGNPTSPPVLLLHGATFRAELWEEIGTMRRLADLGYYAVATDLPGHGKYVQTGFSKDEVMWRLIKRMGLTRPSVIGHSLGGAYAMSLIAAHGDDLAAAVLIAPSQTDRYESRLKNRTLPVLIVWGTADKMIPLSRGRALRSILPGGRLILLHGAPHECYLKDKNAFHFAIEAFLQEHVATKSR